MDASLHRLPIDVLHVFAGDRATMRVRAGSLVPMVDASGPEMDRAETVTIFNDLCVFAPAALLDAEVSWTVLAPDRVHGTFTRGRWSTPLTHYKSVGRRRLVTHGEARWDGQDLDQLFTYLELTIDDVQYASEAHPGTDCDGETPG